MMGFKMLPSIKHGDCRDIMKQLCDEGEIFDAIVCDPPYELTSIVRRFGSPGSAPAKSNGATGVYARASRGFMGKEWDGTGVAFDPATWRAAFDLLKPGGHLVAFGGTRTYHRMAVAIEDAGFEIRDTIMWVYGSGFPKSHDVSKGIDKAAGAERKVIGVRPGHEDFVNRIDRHSAGTRREGWDRPWKDDPEAVLAHHLATAPATSEAAAWSGWGTALKPAIEPIVLARKPLVGTVAANVLAHGVGGLNIDGCRIPRTANDNLQDGITGRDGAALDTGRWPANLVHDGSPEVVGLFPDSRGQIAAAKRDGSPQNNRVYGALRHVSNADPTPRGDSGSAARFFYSAKAAKADRLCGDAATKHPTVKPLALMRWLCRLVTPPGGRILDPFAGSGSTLRAAYDEGFYAIGIEKDQEYIADIQGRIDAIVASKGPPGCQFASKL